MPNNFCRDNIARLKPYIPGYQPENPSRVIKLNANENPYPPSPRVLEALRSHISEDLRLYPNSRSSMLRSQLARVYQMEDNQVFAANGSDETISLIFRTFADPGDLVVSPYPTYTFYQTAAEIHGIEYESIETGPDFQINLHDFLSVPAKLAFVANPNAQTGLLLSRREIDDFLSSFSGLLVLDETYVDFSGGAQSAGSLIQQHDNLLVLRTFSKSFSLCGIRVGYAFGSPRLIEALDKTKDSYNIAYLNQIAAVEALKDIDYMRENAARIAASRQWFGQALTGLGFQVIPSAGNFLLTRHPRIPSREIYQALQERLILVRWFDQPRLCDYVRISMGTDWQLEQVLSALREIISGNPKDSAANIILK